jgi:hypothetical protein
MAEVQESILEVMDAVIAELKQANARFLGGGGGAAAAKAQSKDGAGGGGGGRGAGGRGGVGGVKADEKAESQSKARGAGAAAHAVLTLEDALLNSFDAVIRREVCVLCCAVLYSASAALCTHFTVWLVLWVAGSGVAQSERQDQAVGGRFGAHAKAAHVTTLPPSSPSALSLFCSLLCCVCVGVSVVIC